MFTHKPDICKGCTTLGKPCGRLDKLSTAVGYNLAKADLFLFRKEAALNDYLQKRASAGFSDCFDIVGNILPASVLHHGEIDNHIHLIRSVLYGVSRFECLCSSRHIPIRKADNRTDLQSVANIAFRTGNMTGWNTDRCAMKFDSLVAECSDFFRCAVYPEKGMVTDSEDLIKCDFLFSRKDFIEFVFVVHGNTFFH